MIKELLNTERQDVGKEDLSIHIIKKYEVKTPASKSFMVSNFAVLLVKSGRFKIRVNELREDLSAKDVLIIPAQSYCSLSEVQDKLQLFLISIRSEYIFKNVLRKELADSFYFFIAKTPMKFILEEKEYLVFSLIYKLIHFVHKDTGREESDDEIKRISFNLFLYQLKVIYARYTGNTLLKFSRKESMVIQFLTLLAIHCRKKHSVQFYAGALFVTAGHLNKTVRQATGKTVKSLIANAIVIEAKSLLEDSHTSVNEIAEELEFSSSTSFSIFFKKYTSLTPSQYRSDAVERFKTH